MSNRIRLVLVTVSVALVSYIVVGGVLSRGDTASDTKSSDQTYRDLGVYQEVLSRVSSQYVTEPDLHKVTDGAIRGMLEALDPFSTYFTPEQFKDYLAHPNPGPADVGLYISKRYGYAPVVAVLPGSPADKAGIKPADLIDRIGDTSTRELSVVQVDRMLAGDPGSTVILWVVREARGEPEKVVLNRVVIEHVPVVSKMLEDNTAYIRVARFDAGTAAEVGNKLKGLTAQGASKVVLDLRNCAGGDVNEAVQTASLFIGQGLIAYTSGQRSPREDLTARPQGPVSSLPLAVLINRSTAGPPEIVADAVLNNKRGDVVGGQSFGVGVVEKVVPVGDGSGLLLAAAKYYGPDGKAIQDNGVKPDVPYPPPDEAGVAEEVQPEQFGTQDDLQLQKALDVLKQKVAPDKAA
ncbi:MAG TPA: S41 family peptidase [Terriglobia bacterium]|jgi:carboxyl-terminal processing protease|nr:S41 family peptidase [Terriglobia bacterium]